MKHVKRYLDVETCDERLMVELVEYPSTPQMWSFVDVIVASKRSMPHKIAPLRFESTNLDLLIEALQKARRDLNATQGASLEKEE